MLYADYHLHSRFSCDSQEDPEAVCRRALELGMTHIALTEHVECDLVYDGRPAVIEDPREYALTVERLREKFPGLTLRRGIELGWRDQKWEVGLRALREIRPEFVIGSVHDVHGLDPYEPPYYRGKTRAEAYGLYLDTILEALPALLPCCDTLGHLDYVAKFSPYEDPTLRYTEFPDKLDTILRTVIGAGKLIELNTSTCRNGQAVHKPNLDILRRYRELGGTHITLGSDAHRAENIGGFYDTAEEILSEAGLKVALL
jgi:histidinol-phosphatase (PHP family)